jgi:hypothetical protein
MISPAAQHLSRNRSFRPAAGSQLAVCQGLAQHLLDAGVVAPSGAFDACHQIGSKPEVDMHLRRRGAWTPAAILHALELLRENLAEGLRPLRLPFRVLVVDQERIRIAARASSLKP